MTIPFERYSEFVDKDGKLTLRAASFLEEIVTIEDWREVGVGNEPAFKNSWVDAGTNTAFYKDPFSRVWLKGELGAGASGTVAFTLPEGYRPDESLFILCTQSAAAAGAIVEIQTDGDVAITYTGSVANINNVSFRV